MRKLLTIVFLCLSIGAFAVDREQEIVAFGEALKVAEQGVATAQYRISTIYYKGEGVQKDYKEAFKWSLRAAENGYTIAQINIGEMFRAGRGVPQNYSLAYMWFNLASKNDPKFAQVRDKIKKEMTPSQIEEGERLTREWSEKMFSGDSEEEKPLLAEQLELAEQGNVEAQRLLGGMFCHGNFVQQDYKEGIKWLLKAAEQGDANSQFNLGLMSALGRGVSKNSPQAFMWFKLAASVNYKDSSQALENLIEEMTPEQIGEGQRLTREWLEKHHLEK